MFHRIRVATALAVLASCAAVTPAFASRASAVPIAVAAQAQVAAPDHATVAPALRINVVRDSVSTNISIDTVRASARSVVRSALSAPVPLRSPSRTPTRAPSPIQSIMVSLAGLAMLGTLRNVASDNDSYTVRDTVRQQHNKLVSWLSYRGRNRLISTTTATLPVCARATTASKAKTTNATVAQVSGAAVAVNSADNAWVFTGGNLATGFTRKYLLLVAADGTTFTVQASDDQALAANCSFAAIPADGVAILGVATIANASGAVFIPATTNLNAAGVTTTFIDGDGDDSVLPFGLILPT